MGPNPFLNEVMNRKEHPGRTLGLGAHTGYSKAFGRADPRKAAGPSRAEIEEIINRRVREEVESVQKVEYYI